MCMPDTLKGVLQAAVQARSQIERVMEVTLARHFPRRPNGIETASAV